MPNKLTIMGAHRVEYCALKHAIDRCDNPEHPAYHRYGGRGIKVSERFYGAWGFYMFLSDVGLRPGTGYSLDRIDNDKGYEPGNLRWATRIQQQRNTRKGRAREKDHGHGFGSYVVTRKDGKPMTKSSPYIVHPDGTKKTLYAWAADLGLARSTLRQRLLKNWPLDQALSSTMFTPSGLSSPKPQPLAVTPPPPPPAQVINNVIDLLDASISAISNRTH